MPFFLSLMFSLQQNEGKTGSAWKQGGMAQTMFTHMNKCKNNLKKCVGN
jgi:hypothetical protein